jgi:hypothetical protein
MYDPNYTGTGHQPLGFDEMANLYNHYTVLKASICLSVINNSGYNILVACNVNDGVTGITDPDDFVEAAGTKWMVMGTDSAQGGSKTNMTLKKSVDLGRFFGKSTRSRISTSLYRGNSTTNPTDNAWFLIGAGAFNGTD